MDSSDGTLDSTQLGIATTLSGIPPREALAILAPLRQAREKLILKGGGLHPVFLVTPPFVNIEPDWKNYERIINYLYQEMPDAEAVADYLGTLDINTSLRFLIFCSLQELAEVNYAPMHLIHPHLATSLSGSCCIADFTLLYCSSR